MDLVASCFILLTAIQAISYELEISTTRMDHIVIVVLHSNVFVARFFLLAIRSDVVVSN